MPAGLIKDDNCVCTGADLGSDFTEMQLHGFRVAERQDQSSARSTFGAYCTKHIGGLGTLILQRPRPRAFPGPTICEFVLLADPHLVLKPKLYGCALCKLRADFCHPLREFFLNSSMAVGSCL